MLAAIVPSGHFSFISFLPDEVLLKIIQSIEPADLLSTALVSHRWMNISLDDENFRKICLSRKWSNKGDSQTWRAYAKENTIWSSYFENKKKPALTTSSLQSPYDYTFHSSLDKNRLGIIKWGSLCIQIHDLESRNEILSFQEEKSLGTPIDLAICDSYMAVSYIYNHQHPSFIKLYHTDGTDVQIPAPTLCNWKLTAHPKWLASYDNRQIYVYNPSSGELVYALPTPGIHGLSILDDYLFYRLLATQEYFRCDLDTGQSESIHFTTEPSHALIHYVTDGKKIVTHKESLHLSNTTTFTIAPFYEPHKTLFEFVVTGTIHCFILQNNICAVRATQKQENLVLVDIEQQEMVTFSDDQLISREIHPAAAGHDQMAWKGNTLFIYRKDNVHEVWDFK